MSAVIPLHVHSSYSPGWGIHSPATLCRRARELRLSHLALTDRNGLYGIPIFLEAARAHGLQPLIGSEIRTPEQRAVLLARDADGYANLCRVLSERHCRSEFRLEKALHEWRHGLTVLSDDPALLAALSHAERKHLYVELSPGHNMHEALATARRLRLPPVATSRAVLLNKEELALQRVRCAIHLNSKLSRLPPDATAREWDRLLAPAELAEFFPHCPDALENTRRIAADCRTDWDFSSTIFPSFRGWAEDEAFAELKRRAENGARQRYGSIDARVETRLAKELGIIRTKGFAHYFLVVEELVQQSPRTCGRGSAAASLVAYCLGITHVDPIRHNLFFERFLNPGRTDPPDIDIDFPWDERDAVLDFAFARYGARRTAMVANQISFRGRAALREVAKVFGIPAAEIKNMTERISGYWQTEQTANAMQEHPLFADEPLSEEWQQILEIARRLGGQMRHLSLHCGGLVVVPDEIRRYVPVEVSAKGLPVIQWEKDQAEAAGLVKIDLLGNRSLAVIRDALAAIARNTGHTIDYASWDPLSDAKTRRLLRSGQTMGCFYIESPATRQLLRRMWGDPPDPLTRHCDIFEHLVMASSIIRPAAHGFIREFVSRMRGKPWQPLHPLLNNVLDETYGIAIYQEQITQMAMALAGFSAVEGDQLRKIISKKHKGKSLDDFQRQFLASGAAKGVSEEILLQAWEQILSFSGYSFCKPHSASYALVSCKSAWLRANYPAEFMAAVISNQGGFYSPLAYLSEARRMGLTVLPPDINHSEQRYTGQGDMIRVGLMQIQGLSSKAQGQLIQERSSNGLFKTFADALQRLALDPTDMRLLIKAGCFDSLASRQQRPRLLWELLANKEQPATTAELFSENTADLPHPKPYDVDTLLRQELESLGMLVSCHPLLPYQEQLQRLRPIAARDLSLWVGRYVTLVGWWVTGKVVRTHQGHPMEFITFEDTSAIFDTTFFPRAYARFCRKLSRLRPYVLKGRVEENFGVATLNVEWVGFADEQK